MAITLVDVGTTANDGTGDPLRTAFQTVNTALTTLDPFFSNPLTAAELGELQNIGATTISAGQWGYLGALDQALATTDSPTFAGLTVDTQTLYVDAANNRVGVGTASPTNTLHINATGAEGAGLLLKDNSNAGSAPWIEVIGQRSDINGGQSFSAGLALFGYYSGGAVFNNKYLGTIYFGGNHTDGTITNTVWGASIGGVSEGVFNSASDAPTALVFLTSTTTGQAAIGTANQTYGKERARITSGGDFQWQNAGATVGMTWDASTNSNAGGLGIRTAAPTGALDVNDDTIRVRTAKTPASAAATGNAGDICWDTSYIYVCTATNTWKRSAIATW